MVFFRKHANPRKKNSLPSQMASFFRLWGRAPAPAPPSPPRAPVSNQMTP